MANRLFKQFQLSLEAGVVKLYGSVTTSTSGTVASSTGKGFSIVKTAAEVGRYTITLEDKYISCLAVNVCVVGAADAAYTGAKGLVHFVRGVAVASSPAVIYVQFADPATSADAELENGAKFLVEVVLKNSTAY